MRMHSGETTVPGGFLYFAYVNPDAPKGDLVPGEQCAQFHV